MMDLDNNNCDALGSSIGYPQVKVTCVQFGITVRTYKVRVNFATEPSDYDSLTQTFSNIGSSIITSVRQTVELPCYLIPHYFHFYAQMEKDPPFVSGDTIEAFPQQMDMCAFYMKMKDVPETQFLLVKFAVNVICSCRPEVWKGVVLSGADNFLDCSGNPMMAVSSASPILLSKHPHIFECHGLHQEYCLTISIFDFSQASMVPYEAQRLIAMKNCSRHLHDLFLLHWGTDFDVNINCKGGFCIGAHKAIISARSPVLRKAVETTCKTSPCTIHHADLTAQTMKIILHFVYTGELDSEWRSVPAEDIVYGANKLELHELVKFFDHLLIVGCTYGNALRLAKLAERHSLQTAKTMIIAFIENNLPAVFSKSVPSVVRRS